MAYHLTRFAVQGFERSGRFAPAFSELSFTFSRWILKVEKMKSKCYMLLSRDVTGSRSLHSDLQQTSCDCYSFPPRNISDVATAKKMR